MGFTITAAELIAFLTAQGFHIETGRGRHGTKAVKGGLQVSIPMHGGDLKDGTARSILRQAGYKPADVMNWRR
ncbi:MAG: type II toxin-antitoxin system HicA family toxin [Synergistaceae bacterium]|jgi:predicted RNA binding protein YcfA (HicA-like mRNA interferase family)|nr:type II toxin-antitoxin system HicA family toxin [Synergistaceae bacterium]